ncbi:hypothetical protein R1flu_000430 [Riccia fluitans]|uniref:Uncharacterized protein n=1 Tax=Riccia fluitans TaxID=41844 RepID=A0ABD1Y0W6_9MARC
MLSHLTNAVFARPSAFIPHKKAQQGGFKSSVASLLHFSVLDPESASQTSADNVVSNASPLNKTRLLFIDHLRLPGRIQGIPLLSPPRVPSTPQQVRELPVGLNGCPGVSPCCHGLASLLSFSSYRALRFRHREAGRATLPSSCHWIKPSREGCRCIWTIVVESLLQLLHSPGFLLQEDPPNVALRWMILALIRLICYLRVELSDGSVACSRPAGDGGFLCLGSEQPRSHCGLIVEPLRLERWQ